MSWLSKCLIAAVLVGLGLAIGFGPDLWLRRQVVVEETDYEKAQAYKTLFERLGKAGLHRLLEDRDTGLALQAAWEVNRKAVKRVENIQGRTDWCFDEDGMKAFLAFVSSRIGEDPPGWWKEVLLDGDVFPGQHHAFWHRVKDFHDTPLGVRCPEGVNILADGDNVVIKVGDTAATLPKSIVDGKTGLDTFLTASVGGERTVLALYPGRAYEYELICCSTANGHILWKAAVWAARRGPSSGPSIGHYVEVRQNPECVILFGVESHGAYIEAFDAVTGQSLFRFCTCYWFNFSEAWKL